MKSMSTAAPPRGAHHKHHLYTELRALRAVATVELTKGVISVAIMVGLLLLLHRDYWNIADRILDFLHISEDRHFAQVFLDWADRLNDNKILLTASVVAAYASLRFLEGFGLWHARPWAEWVALVSGSVYIPFEVFKIITKPSWFHVVLLVLNVVIVLYMAYLRWKAHVERRCATHPIQSTMSS